MTVGELIALLSDFPEDAEVRLMTQPSYPFQHSVAGVVDAASIVAAAEDDGADALNDFRGDVPGATVYLLEGSQLGYGSSTAWRA